jgi:hypothetical protein
MPLRARPEEASTLYRLLPTRLSSVRVLSKIIPRCCYSSGPASSFFTRQAP